MGWFTFLVLVFCLLLVAGFIIYSVNVNKIIREQEKEIAYLNTTIKRMQQKDNIVNISRINVPDFDQW